MEPIEREQDIHKLFLFVVILKGLNALLEVILAILLSSYGFIWPYVQDLANGELIEDPTDFVANHMSFLPHPTHASLVFASLYLLAHGTVKLFLAIGLWYNKIWAYPAAMSIISLFILYQIIRVLEHGSMLLLALTVLDCGFVWLTYHEYRKALKRGTIF